MPVELGSFSFGFVAGGAVVGVINHYLAKSRDIESRSVKDFNEAADILDAILHKERHGPMPETNIDFSAFQRVLRQKNELIRFERYVEEYHQARKNAEIVFPENRGDLVRAGSTGWYHDANPIVLAIDKLLECTKRK